MGVTRKMMSMSTLGLIDFRSDKERIARSTRLLHHEVRRQRKATTVVTAPATRSAHRQPSVVARWWRTRTPWVERLVREPDLDVRWFFVWLSVTLFCLVATWQSLLITIPVGVHLLLCRQKAARIRRQREQDATLARMSDDAPTVAFPAIR